MRRGKNNCGWLLRGRKEKCGKPCEGEYCKRHNYKLRNGSTNHAPCKGCGVGVKTDYRLCGDYGGKVLKHRLRRKERKARQQYEKVMRELLAKTN